MLSSVLGSLQELLGVFEVSIGTLIFVAVVTVVLWALMLTGQTARIGVWFEDLMYRFGMWGG